MKSIINVLLTTTIAVAAVVLTTSCESISNPEPISVIDSTKTATIQGAVLANFEIPNDTTGNQKNDWERAPENTSVKVVLDSEQFANTTVGGVNYQNLTFTTTVDASGNYSIEVPALDEPITAEIFLGDFSATQMQADSSLEIKTYSPDSFPYLVTVVAGLTTVNDVTYIAN